MISKMEVS